jgi:hypothetical protein
MGRGGERRVTDGEEGSTAATALSRIAMDGAKREGNLNVSHVVSPASPRPPHARSRCLREPGHRKTDSSFVFYEPGSVGAFASARTGLLHPGNQTGGACIPRAWPAHIQGTKQGRIACGGQCRSVETWRSN